MTRVLETGTAAAVTAGHVPYVFFVELSFAEYLRVCSAGYTMFWRGYNWIGLGTLGGIEPIQEKASLEASGVSLTLSGVPTELVAVSLLEKYQGRSCKIWFAPLSDDLQLLLQPVLLFSGRMDTMNTEVGETATITVTAESRMVAWDRPKIRRFNHEDQISRYPGDRGLECVSQMVEKTLQWGR